jgi:hypothetical protein
MNCKAGQVQDGGLCYESAGREGWKMLAGTWSQNCPAGATDIGVACQRDSYNRGIGNVPLTIRMKARKP